MARFQRLHKAIQAIRNDGVPGRRVKGKWQKTQRLGTNIELARFCGIRESQSQKWFWKQTPTAIPRAHVTLLALRWVCEKRKVKGVLIPGWEVIWFWIFVKLHGVEHDRNLLARKLGYRADQVRPESPNEEYSLRTLADELKLSPKTLQQYAQPPWKAGKRTRGSSSREPDGDFALYFLADLLTKTNLESFIDFIMFQLKEDPAFNSGYPYDDLPKNLAAQYRLSHDQLDQEAQRLNAYLISVKDDDQKGRKLYRHHVKAMPPWLKSILL